MYDDPRYFLITFAFAGDSTMRSGTPIGDGDEDVDDAVDEVRDVRVDFMGASSTHTSQESSGALPRKPLQILRKRKT
jgi:hypothetical protein